MINNIIICIAAVLFVVAYIVSGIYNLHMFQQNTYIAGEEIAWLKKNNDRQRILLLDIIFALLDLAVNVPFTKGVFSAMMLLNIWYFIQMEKISNKKVLVIDLWYSSLE